MLNIITVYLICIFIYSWSVCFPSYRYLGNKEDTYLWVPTVLWLLSVAPHLVWSISWLPVNILYYIIFLNKSVPSVSQHHPHWLLNISPPSSSQGGKSNATLSHDCLVLNQTLCWGTSLFSARPCSWTTRMWCCEVVFNLWGCINYQFVLFKFRSYHDSWELHARTQNATALTCTGCLCATTTERRLCLFYPSLSVQIQFAHEELMNSQTRINRWLPGDL